MKRKFFLSVVFSLVSFGVTLWAQESDTGMGYTIEKKVFVPPRFYVGDQAELRLEININKDLKPNVPTSLPSTRWLRIDRIKVERLGDGRYRVRLFFTSFQPGTQLLPTLSLGGIKLRNIQIYTSSVLKDTGDTQLGLFKGELLLPGTIYSILLLVFIIIGMPVVMIVAYIYLKKLVKYVGFRIKSRRPFLYARVNLLKLERNLGKLEEKKFYTELTRVLKLYLSMKYSRNFDVLTTMEMRREIESLIGDRALNEKIGELLSDSDRVKFQGLTSSRASMIKSLKDTSDIIKRIEEFAPIVEF